MKKYLWKSMCAGIKSKNGDIKWEVGEWQQHKGALKLCEAGFHASENVIDAMGFVATEVIAKVEVRGKSIKEKDKQVWSEMRIVKAYDWTKEDSVKLAVYAAELVIGIYEKQHPNDSRPRKAIEAAKQWLKLPNHKGAVAARAEAEAEAEWAAWAARAAAARAEAEAEAAGAAAWAAAGATGAAWAAAAAAAAAWAAWAGATGARAEAEAAEWAAWAAATAARAEAEAEAEIKSKCSKFVREILSKK